MVCVEKGLFDSGADAGVDGGCERDMVYEAYAPGGAGERKEGGGARVEEGVYGVCEGVGVDEDIGVEDPENVVLCVAVGADEVVDFRVYADDVLAC